MSIDFVVRPLEGTDRVPEIFLERGLGVESVRALFGDSAYKVKVLDRGCGNSAMPEAAGEELRLLELCFLTPQSSDRGFSAPAELAKSS